MAQQFQIHFCVPPDDEFLIAELYYQGEHFGEVNTGDVQLNLMLFPRTSGESWTFSLEDALESSQSAQKQLISRSTYFRS